jgi:tetratricopeptide (TPR) repeat protein
MAECLHSLGSVAYATEVYEQAERYYAESLNFFRQAGDRTGVTRALNSLGNVAYELGDDKKAMRLYQESLALSREIGNQWGMAGSLRGSEEQVE